MPVDVDLNTISPSLEDGPDLEDDELPRHSDPDTHDPYTTIFGNVGKKKFSSFLECDKIQDPPKGHFKREDLKWYGPLSKEEAWIPYRRLPDFIRGEEIRERLNCIFSKRKSVKYRSNFTGPVLKKTTTYRCCFGPQNYRELTKSTVPESRKTREGKNYLKLKITTGLSCRRGCRCTFTVTQQNDRKGAVLLKFVNKLYVDKFSKQVHGMDDSSAYEVGAHIAPRLSRWSRAYVERCLMAKMTPDTIIKDHNEAIITKYRKDNPDEDIPQSFFTRDMLLNKVDIRVVREGWRRRLPDYSTKDHVAVKTWTLHEPEWVYLYKETNLSRDQKFKLVWGSKWQLKKLSELGHGGAVAMDATFKTNIYGYPLYTLMVFDKFHRGIPVVWIVMEQWKESDVAEFLQCVKDTVNLYRKSMGLDYNGPWCPNCFIVDCALEERNAILHVFPGMIVQLCIWHVRKAWSKNLIMKVNCPFSKALINRELDTLMYSRNTDPELDSIAFMNRWALKPETSHFAKYYKDEWHAKISGWATQMRTYPHASQDTNGAIERYHGLLKLQLRIDKASVAGRKIVWLIQQCMMWENTMWAEMGKQWQGSIRNAAVESQVWTTITRAKKISPDSIMLIEDGAEKWALVKSVSNQEESYLVQRYDKDNCMCSCGYSLQGNACKHYVSSIIAITDCVYYGHSS